MKWSATPSTGTVMRRGQSSGATLNAANEEGVAAFLDPDRNLPFHRIAELAREALETLPIGPLRDLSDLAEAESMARDLGPKNAAMLTAFLRRHPDAVTARPDGSLPSGKAPAASRGGERPSSKRHRTTASGYL